MSDGQAVLVEDQFHFLASWDLNQITRTCHVQPQSEGPVHNQDPKRIKKVVCILYMFV